MHGVRSSIGGAGLAARPRGLRRSGERTLPLVVSRVKTTFRRLYGIVLKYWGLEYYGRHLGLEKKKTRSCDGCA